MAIMPAILAAGGVAGGLYGAFEIADLLLGSRRRALQAVSRAGARSSSSFNTRQAQSLLAEESERIKAFDASAKLLDSRMDRVYGPSPEAINSLQTNALVDAIINRHRAKAQQLAQLSRPGPVEQIMIERLTRATTL